MRRMHKKGALELSINAIVIVILAMTLLGLGLGFVRKMFTDIGDTTSQVQGQMKEQILDDLRRGDKRLSFPSARLDVESGKEELIVIGIKNTEPTTLNFKFLIEEVIGGDELPIPIVSDPSLNTGGTGDTKVIQAFFWDDSAQVLTAGESNVYVITLKADRTASGTKLFKMKVMDIEGTDDTSDDSEYISKTFFVRYI